MTEMDDTTCWQEMDTPSTMLSNKMYDSQPQYWTLFRKWHGVSKELYILQATCYLWEIISTYSIIEKDVFSKRERLCGGDGLAGHVSQPCHSER